MNDFMNANHDIYDSQSQNSSLEIGIGHERKELGKLIGKVISVPETQPWQPEKENPYLDGEENIDDSEDPDHDGGTSPESVSSDRLLGLG